MKSKDMLVEKGQCVGINNEDNTATPYEVIMADDEYFVLGQVIPTNKELTEFTTDLENISIYSNDGTLSLAEMNMFIVD